MFISAYGEEPRISLIEGEVQDTYTLKRALHGINMIYSNIGEIDFAIFTFYASDWL